jgi:hypothetical protein
MSSGRQSILRAHRAVPRIWQGAGFRAIQSLRRICDSNATGKKLEFEAVFSGKQANHCGLQLADLVARPIGRHVMRPDQTNRAYDILEPKFRRSPEGRIEGWGLKCYP